jgi:hypothetical protein
MPEEQTSSSLLSTPVIAPIVDIARFYDIHGTAPVLYKGVARRST